MATRFHEIVQANAPDLSPKTWYGMPAYANEDGKVVCFFTPAAKFKERYATFGFNPSANLDDGNMWPTSWALNELTAAEEKKIAGLVKKARRAGGSSLEGDDHGHRDENAVAGTSRRRQPRSPPPPPPTPPSLIRTKPPLTVFTGVSGSGKSSLVFGTIAAESQRLINETYSAFVQGFMPTLARPEVDVLDGLTTAIIVDQERMGANPRSTVGTVTDANAMLRILFSRLGKPHIGSPNAFSFNVPSVRGERGDHRREGRQDEDRGATFTSTSAACARGARAWARSTTST